MSAKGVAMTVEELAGKLTELLGDAERVMTARPVLEKLSKDFYWYSPILKRQLEDKNGDVAVQPVSTQEVVAVVRFAYAAGVPVTVRGAGTGNYGQCIPLEGGIVLDLSRMDKLEEITPDGVAVCQPGLRLAPLEVEARRQDWELRMYPSTLAKATVGGFLAGGSGGIGSVTHGGLRDFDNVKAVEVVTMEAEPRVVMHEGEAVREILHSWGTNGVITRAWFALTPAVEWVQVTAAFFTYEEGFRFARKVAESERWQKRLVTVFEWPIPSFFAPVQKVVAADKTLVLVMIANVQVGALKEAAEVAGGKVTFVGPYTGPKSQPLLSDYTWNHTTLWAMKADPKWTYLQAGFSPTVCMEQFRRLKEKYGDDVLLHIEFMKNGEGVVVPGAIPLVYYRGDEQLQEMIAFCRGMGVSIANPHVNNLEDGGRFRSDNVQLAAKYKYDPKGLLNPGKMLSFEKRRS